MSEVLETKRLVSAAALGLVLGAAGCSKPAEERPDRPAVGLDVSFPQCGQPLPQPEDFAVVGVNGNLANNFNQCFDDEVAWAAGSTGQSSLPVVMSYVRTANPGSKQASHWPSRGKNQYCTCQGGDTLACDYEYGASLAASDLQQLADQPEAARMIWLDVEPEESWRSSNDRNRTALEGMTDTFETQGSAVGVYSSPSIWQELIGSVPPDSSLAGLPNWVLGADSLEGAKTNCRTGSFTGQVLLAQIVQAGELDQNLACETAYRVP